ncbi:nitroreductase/quinone reductase family protein [Kineococcus sp. SYSU DK001]|uniref:nitroreductase/quinone reductase family protein n=1 Tax=Kineococcus sp. SYSU DK001 TaxID=3383122 RepID=UPI003D7DFC1A
MPDPTSTAVQRALDLGPSSTAAQRTVRTTTTGARTGRPRRIETRLHRHEERWFLSGLPGRRDRYANLPADPHLVVHLGHGVRADLPAVATRVDDEEERRRISSSSVADLDRPHDPARLPGPTRLQDRVAGSPLVELHFTAPRTTSGTPADVTTDNPGDTPCAP